MSRRPNVLYLVLDSVRYDRTSVGGHHRNTTPNLQRIADTAEGRSFETAIAHGRYTATSTASMLTGRYPGQHRFGYDSTTLSSSAPTVPEAFRDAGYDTACISNNAFLNRETGLARGFEDFELLPNSPLDLLGTVGLGAMFRFLWNIRRHSGGFQRDSLRHSGAFLVTSLIEHQLDRLRSSERPFFLYAHYNQPHRPYYPPLAWFDTYAEDFQMSLHEAGEFSMDVHENMERYVTEGCPFTDDEWAVLKALYDTEIAYTDTFVGSLFDRVQAEFGDTVFVVTADHGEHFGERGALAHRYALDDALLHVPLVTSGLGLDDRPELVQHTDVMRTLLEQAGADSSFVDGVDLTRESREIAVSQDGGISLAPLREHDPDLDGDRFFPGAEESIPERTAVRTTSHRYVRSVDGTETLFALPDEETDVAEVERSVLSGLRSELSTWLEGRRESEPTVANDGDITDGTRARLRDMGYLDEDL